MRIMLWLTVTALATTACGAAVPAATHDDPPGLVMGTKEPAGGGLVLMVSREKQGSGAYERTVSRRQARACTVRPLQPYPRCLP